MAFNCFLSGKIVTEKDSGWTGVLGRGGREREKYADSTLRVAATCHNRICEGKFAEGHRSEREKSESNEKNLQEKMELKKK